MRAYECQRAGLLKLNLFDFSLKFVSPLRWIGFLKKGSCLVYLKVTKWFAIQEVPLTRKVSFFIPEGSGL